MYLCPLCQQPLQLIARSYACNNRHQFDVAKEGYVNLLPVQHKKSLDPGDNLQMIQARRAFLNAGHYQPLADAIIALLQPQLSTPKTLLDIGCGEGYYSGHIANACPLLQVQGLDISKAAVRLAAKAYRQANYCVASSYQLPFADNSFDLLLRIYAPSKADELQRVLKNGGYLCTVTPAPQHLLEIKQQLYSQVRLHPAEIASEGELQHVSRQHLSWQWQAPDAVTLAQLLEMIPLGYRITPALLSHLMAQRPPLTLDFYIDLYQKLANAS